MPCKKYILLIAFGVYPSRPFRPVRMILTTRNPKTTRPMAVFIENNRASITIAVLAKDTSDKYKNIAPRAGNNDPYEPHEARAPKGSDAAIMRGLLQDR